MATHYIQLSEASCRNCMRCVRNCPTNAMTYIHNQPTILEDECILCGNCYSVCRHDAKKIISDFNKVKTWLANGEKVIMSVAPSFVSVWPRFSSLTKILKSRGFYAVEETARGAAVVSKAYENLIKEHKMKNIITTCCPAANSLIEKEYGDLVEFMAPVESPMIVHAKMIKEEHPDAKVVFLSPCIAKYKEIHDERFAGYVDACINMQELFEWIENEPCVNEESDWQDFEGSISRLYPTSGGILTTLENKDNYKFVSVEGIDRIKSFLEAIRNGHLEGYFFEVNACIGSCMGGPLLSHFAHNEWVGQSVIRQNVDFNKTISSGKLPCNVDAVWKKEDIYRPHHTKEEIEAEMIRMGKTSPDKIHDCGACGYETCYEKAIAVLEGKADPKICLPEALAHAESLSNVVIDNTPNGIVVIDENYNILEMNPSARRMLDLEMVNPTGMPLISVLPSKELEEAIQSKSRRVNNIRVEYDMYNKLVDHAIFKVPDETYTVLILMDRTNEELKEKMLRNLREKTMNVTQQVIDDQMRTVQEIASLLGETTAKSKVALTKLKEAMDESDE